MVNVQILATTNCAFSFTRWFADIASVTVTRKKYTNSLDGANMGGFFGKTVYRTIGLNDAFALSLGGEYFVLNNLEAVEGTEANIMSFKASGNFTVGDLIISPELRYNTGNNGFLFASNAENTAAASFVLAAIYGF